MRWPSPQDYNEAVQNLQQSVGDAELRSGQPELNKLGIPKAISGGRATVYRITTSKAVWALRCFQGRVADQEQRYDAISRRLDTVGLSCTVRFEYIARGIKVWGDWYPIVKMEWVHGQRLDAYVYQNLSNKRRLSELVVKWQQLVAQLAAAGVAHGDLQDGNILLVGDELKLIDYDGMYVPELAGREACELGHRNYQHPGRTDELFGPDLDRFSSLVIYTSLLALSHDPTLWHDVHTGPDGDEYLLFRAQDYRHPQGSVILKRLTGSGQSEVSEAAKLLAQAASGVSQSVPTLGSHSRPDSSPPTAEPWWRQARSTAKPPGVRAAATASLDLSAFGLPAPSQPATAPSLPPPPPPPPPDAFRWWEDHRPVPAPESEPVAPFRLLAPRLGLVVLMVGCFALYWTTGAAIAAGIMFAPSTLLVFVVLYMREPGRAVRRDRLDALRAARDEAAGRLAGLHEAEESLRELGRQRAQELDVFRAARRTAEAEHKMEAERTIDDLRRQRLACERTRDGRLQQLASGCDATHARCDMELRSVQSELTSLDRSESEWRSEARRVARENFIERTLRARRIPAQGIANVGASTVENLRRYGYSTAFDLDKRQTGLIDVPGIGPERARALTDWLHRVYQQAQRAAPTALPPDEDRSISQQMQVRRTTLLTAKRRCEQDLRQADRERQRQHEPIVQQCEADLKRINEDGPRLAEHIKRKYKRKYADLDRQHRDAIAALDRRLPDLHDVVAARTRELKKAELQVAVVDTQIKQLPALTFGAYLSQVLWPFRRNASRPRPGTP